VSWQRRQSGRGCSHAQCRQGEARRARSELALHHRRHQRAPSASCRQLAVHAAGARFVRLTSRLAGYTHRKVASVTGRLAASIVDGRERAMYRKSDLRKSVRNSQNPPRQLPSLDTRHVVGPGPRTCNRTTDGAETFAFFSRACGAPASAAILLYSGVMQKKGYNSASAMRTARFIHSRTRSRHACRHEVPAGPSLAASGHGSFYSHFLPPVRGLFSF
jgi:hypothetical protein